MDERLLNEFLSEAEDLIEELYGEIAELRARREDGRARRALVARIFRQVHTIKGSAASAGLAATVELSHELESLLDAVRAGRARLDDEAINACEEAVACLAAGLEAAARGEAADAPRATVERLRRLASSASEAPAGEGDVDKLLPEALAGALSAHERQRLREAVAEGAGAHVVEADFDLATFDEQYRRLSAALGEAGEVVSAQPFVDAAAPERVGFRILYASAETREQVAARVAPFGARVSGDEGRNEGEGVEEDSTAHVSGTQPTEAQPSKSVRVSLEELDELISAAHSLFAETLGALELARAAEGAELEPHPAGDERESRAARVRRGFSELEGRLIALRMVPLRATLARAARAGASVARAAGKSIEIETAGGEVTLDRSLADRVAEPLLHLIRNAVDHGVEDAGERRAAGKREAGLVRVEALAEEGRVVLRVSDDGRGVDAARVARAAAERGLLKPGAELTDEQALRLIFRHGFSTAPRATLLSGRGVGLDVVERAVEEIGGEVRVRSVSGRGTAFEMRLPTTLALLPAHVVRCGGRRYCLGAGQVVETNEAVGADIVRADGRRMLRWRGRELPLSHLSEILGLTSAHDGDGVSVEGDADDSRFTYVVARARRGVGGDGAGNHAALIVDDVEGRGDVLVRGLGRHAKRWRGVTGATELRDGGVALVLDLPRLIEAALESGPLK